MSAELSLREEVLLLALDDEKGSEGSEGTLGYGLAAAILVELASAGCLVEEHGKLVPGPEGAPHDPLLADALDEIASSRKPRKAQHWVERLPSKPGDLKQRVAGGLVERGVLEEDRGRVLGLIPRTRYPQADPGPERSLRERLAAVLLEGREPSPHDALLLAVIEPLDLVKRVVPKDRRKDAARRAREVADPGLLGSAVGDAAAVAAATAAAGAAAAATAASSGS